MSSRNHPSPLLDRRALLAAGAGGLGAALLSRLLGPGQALAQGNPTPQARAKACIVLWMNGGPSHLDTFDPKPGSRSAGPARAIKTRVKGVEISEHLPQLAAQAHRLCFLRGLTSKEGNHDRARYLLHTGYAPNPTVAHPSLGGWVSEELAARDGDLPAFVSLGGPSMGAGFLGVQHGPFFVPRSGAPQNVALPRSVDAARFDLRRAALDDMEGRFAAETGDPQVAGRRAVYAQSVKMMRSPQLKAFDASDEPEKLRKAYGDTDFGRSCLTARRLVESGVRLVEVVLDGWDTHQNNFDRTGKLMATLDPAMASLLADLDARKLLSSTLVVCLGEFGRTPRINANEGRDHYPQAWSCALAGGGLRGGVAHGNTDADGAKVVDKPTTVPALFATLTTLMGIDPARSVTTPSGRPISVTDAGTPIRELFA
jgi:uncharacterized protein (DUF1501 family)